MTFMDIHWYNNYRRETVNTEILVKLRNKNFYKLLIITYVVMIYNMTTVFSTKVGESLFYHFNSAFFNEF